MTPDLEAKLKACPSLPTPPGVANRIIQLANDPEVGIDEVVKVVSMDPALTSKILRIANSPLYPQKMKVEKLGQAILLIGLNGILSLALSFSLVKSLKTQKSEGLNYSLFWRRALLAGIASRALGEACGQRDIEELFIAALIQDIGMLALDQAFPGLYAKNDLDQTSHSCMINHEQEQLGIDHAAAGSWLLRTWNLPERLQLAVASSENPGQAPPSHNQSTFIRCVSLSGVIANLYLAKTNDEMFEDVAQKAQDWLKLDRTQITDILKDMEPLIAEAATLFDINLRKDMNPEFILESAREALLLRNLETIQQLDSLRNNTVLLESQCYHLEITSRSDPLTGLFNRGHLDELLKSSFEKSCRNHEPLSLCFVDLDKFKFVNDTYGHKAGDEIIKATADILTSCVRGTDFVGRFGGDEFVVILPGADSGTAQAVCCRMEQKFRDAHHDVGAPDRIQVTASIGFATHDQEHQFRSVEDLLNAADQNLYSLKK